MATLKAVVKTNQLKQYLGLMQHIQRLAPWQEQACLEQMNRGDLSARQRLIQSYLPRVIGWAAPWRGPQMSFEGLIAIGNQAVIRTLKQTSQCQSLKARLKKAVLADLDKALRQLSKS